ncbi:sugar ABC transporter ATP-binding protein [Demequina sp. NBRC 110057]|uniref:sugar ABC transporter ATP-binding protein n=1 Tax=Demequina sp. NBRC 110057 TaxID=1570346 RepID=UPI0009FC05CC|nr:sugar ABC transporter ATP-binding protein [Demequina sp. NBRC 110057]
MTTPPTQGHSTPALKLKDVAKAFGSVVALKRADLTLAHGSIHALIGENGAGKSTLVKIIAGVYQRDAGTLEYDGEPVDFASTADSKAAGIAVIYQEPTLFPDLSVAENVFMGRQPLRSLGRIDTRAMREQVAAIFSELGVDIDPDRPTRGLSIADQQLIEIAKAISLDAKVLIMDEPTAALSGVEVERLFTVARSLRDQGCAIMFISHRFDEVFALCDTVTVMRDGEYIATSPIADTTVEAMVRQMVGRDVEALFPKVESEIGDVVLRVDGLHQTGEFTDVSFDVRAGEIVALAGLVGAGRSEIARAIFGVDPYEGGTVSVGGNTVRRKDPADAMRKGIALVPEDRRHQGVVLESSVARNVTMAIRRTLARGGLLWGGIENTAAREWAARLEVKTAALDAESGTLSGGNQQKVVLAKWLATHPRVLIIDEPTRGIDVGTKAEVHRLLSTLASQGLAVLMISSELPEVLGMADRILVVHEGRITAHLPRETATAENIMFAATHAAEEAA